MGKTYVYTLRDEYGCWFTPRNSRIFKTRDYATARAMQQFLLKATGEKFEIYQDEEKIE